MRRLVYSPSISAWVKTDTGVFDISSYITDFTIHRKVNQVSTAEVTLRNPKVDQNDGKPRYLFTEHKSVTSDGSVTYQPMFHPMDPIIITLTRLKGHPVQVFTGYCDESPYVQLFPGTAKLTASCTLKRLLYTYWDPGLPVVLEYLASKGWLLTGSGTTLNPKAESTTGNNLDDSSIGFLLYSILKDIGGWSDQDIFVQGLPSKQIGDIVAGIYQDLTGDAKASFKVFQDFLTKVIGAESHGWQTALDTSATPNTPNGPSAPGSLTNPGKLGNDWEKVANEYSGNYYSRGTGGGGTNVGYLNALINNAPSRGQISNDYNIVKKVAKEVKIPFVLLWACYGAESSWGKAASWFGLTGAHGPSGTTGNFENDARESAQTWLRLYKQIHNKNPDY